MGHFLYVALRLYIHGLKKVLFHQPRQLLALGIVGSGIYIRYHTGLCMAGIPLHGFYIAFAEFQL